MGIDNAPLGSPVHSSISSFNIACTVDPFEVGSDWLAGLLDEKAYTAAVRVNRKRMEAAAREPFARSGANINSQEFHTGNIRRRR
jgi:hypothetical protein